jgi:Tfp pilus assembly protein PilO
LLSARAARSGYVQEVHSLQRLSTAIPPTDGVPELLREISALAGGHSVNFQNISLTPGSSTSAGFNTIQLSFTFTAGYVQLQNFLQAVDSLTRTDGTNVLADGRLVTFDSIGLSPLPPDSTQASVTATIYQTPSATGVTGASGTASTTSTSGATAP